MKVQNTIQINLEQEEINTLIDMRMLLEELCNIMEDTHSTTLTIVVDDGFENKYQTWTESELTKMLQSVKNFWGKSNFLSFFKRTYTRGPACFWPGAKSSNTDIRLY